MGTAFGAISIFFTTVNGIRTSLGAAAGTLTASIETKAISIAGDKLVYFIDQITSHLSNAEKQTSMILEIYGSDKENGPFILLDTLDLSLEDPGFLDPPGQRYYKLRYVDTAVKERWHLHGFNVYGEAGGEEF